MIYRSRLAKVRGSAVHDKASDMCATMADFGAGAERLQLLRAE